MPKVKTHSSCKKRFKKTASGLLKRSAAFRRHHSWAKAHKNVRSLRKGRYIDATLCDKIESLMPY
ncbi:MAG: 50S ribosomal protein L35 [Candidatus Babeliales bacterium]|jgi:large subunit ribosomal protein L35